MDRSGGACHLDLDRDVPTHRVGIRADAIRFGHQHFGGSLIEPRKHDLKRDGKADRAAVEALNGQLAALGKALRNTAVR